MSIYRRANHGTIFTATFAGVSVSAAQDAFELVTPATTRARLIEIRLGQYSDSGDSAAEMLSVQLIRGFTTSGSGGSAVTPTNFAPYSRAAACSVEANNTTVAQDGTGRVLIADAFNVMAGWWYAPPDEQEQIILEVSTRLVCRITAPTDALTMNGTMVWAEIGKPPTS